MIDHPGIQPIASLEFLARQVVEGFITGLHKSPYHGFSVEFAEHRLYNTGESTRHLDWKLYARTEKLFIKRYEEETNLRCQLVLDASSSMYFPADGKPSLQPANKAGFSALAAASILNLLKNQRDAVGLTAFDSEVRIHTHAKSSYSHMQLLYAHLERLWHPFEQGQSSGTRLAAALHSVAEQVHKRSLVVVFSDFLGDDQQMEDLMGALQHLRHNKHEVILFQTTHQALEQELSFDNRPHHFIDMETGEELKLNPAEVREAYLSRMAAHQQTLRMKCAGMRIDLVEADIAQGFYSVLLSYLLKRSRMV